MQDWAKRDVLKRKLPMPIIQAFYSGRRSNSAGVSVLNRVDTSEIGDKHEVGLVTPSDRKALQRIVVHPDALCTELESIASVSAPNRPLV